jgi:hypothetical protein
MFIYFNGVLIPVLNRVFPIHLLFDNILMYLLEFKGKTERSDWWWDCGKMYSTFEDTAPDKSSQIHCTRPGCSPLGDFVVLFARPVLRVIEMISHKGLNFYNI